LVASFAVGATATAQELNPAEPAQPGASDQAAAPAAAEETRVVRRMVVLGTQRIEPATVLSYITLHVGDTYSEAAIDRALKALFATGLFSDVKIRWDGSTVTVNVVENPIINQVAFEGNSKVTTKDLTKEVQLKPRMVFTRAKVRSDIQRIIELYRRNGKFAASVDPQIIQRPQNRVDLIFSINEGPTTGVARINFVGNKIFDDDTLREQIATVESAWWRILATNDNFDPDRLLFDREQLRRFYVSHGYADFHVISAVAELTPDHSAFYITFTVDEGPKYKFGKIEINSKIKELPTQTLLPLVKINAGAVYDENLVESAKDALIGAVGSKGYANADVGVRLRRNIETKTIDLIMNIEPGPRVYVDKISVVGNTRTLDRVIRRELRFAEGDAFNRQLVDRSRTRIRALGFFRDVTIKNSPGSRRDKTDITVAVAEQSTGELSLGAGYSSTSSFVGEFAYTERNLFGRGQYMRASIAMSTLSKQFQFSFTEPWFLDRPLAAGFDLYKWITNYNQADYQGDATAASLRFRFPTSEYGSIGLHYTYRLNKVTPYSSAPLEVQLAAGSTRTSELGYSFIFNTLDDVIKPTSGIVFAFSQDFAGVGGNLKFLKTEGTLATYRKLIGDSFVGSLTLSSGFITGYGGMTIPIQERYFKGGDSFRGFKLAGIGPRDITVSGDAGAVGGDFFAIGTAEVRLPDILPADYGMKFSLFSDFGTLGHLDSAASRFCGTVGGYTGCIKDNLALRVSTGISIGWKSPFGPVQIDLGVPLVKAPYDKTEFIHFSAGTGY
ncbi:MAG TPA: outer membrane protein assembly factor BamA, partial [Rhizomicrobium sp.]